MQHPSIVAYSVDDSELNKQGLVSESVLLQRYQEADAKGKTNFPADALPNMNKLVEERAEREKREKEKEDRQYFRNSS